MVRAFWGLPHKNLRELRLPILLKEARRFNRVCTLSDNFEMLVDAEVTLGQADMVKQRILAMLHHHELIVREADMECALGGLGYRPGPAVHKIYELTESELPFWDQITCGVELRVGRDFNHWAYGTSCEGYSCPLCSQKFEPEDEDLAEVLAEAIGEWIEQSGPALVLCPSCTREVPVADWRCTPPLGFGNLSVVFWNWPPLDSRSWRIDIPELIHQATFHPLIRTLGHV
jgi:hypothetical protein